MRSVTPHGPSALCRPILLVIVLVLSLTGVDAAAAPVVRRPAATHLDRTGLFEPNIGQFPPATKFVAHAGGYDVLFGEDHVDFVTASMRQFRMKFPGAHVAAPPEGSNPADATVSVFAGRHSSRSGTGMPMFREVRYRSVYRGIDLSFYFTAGRLEHTWLLAPDADPAAIRVSFDGAQKVETDGSEVLVRAASGVFRLLTPLVYEDARRERRPIAARYVALPRQTVAFSLGAHRRGSRIAIDPVIEYATFLGGSALDWMESGTIAIDPEGNVYVSGKTSSPNLPGREGSVQPFLRGDPDLFVAKFRPDGALVFTAYVGGTGFETDSSSIAADSTGVYIACGTESRDFPTTPDAYQPVHAPTTGLNGPKPAMDGALAKISPDGTRLLYGTFFGGSDDDRFDGIALGRDGRIVVAGRTSATDFPVTSNAYQRQLHPSKSSHPSDAVVVVFDAAGRLMASTLLGGSDMPFGNLGEQHAGVLVDDDNNVIVMGRTNSFDFPTTEGAMQRALAGSDDGFLTKLTPDLSQLIFSTYFGGLSLDYPRQVAFDPSGDFYVIGETDSADWPAADPVGQTDAFICRIAADGSHLVWGRHVGGSRIDWAYAVVAGRANSVWVSGLTSSDDLPITSDAIQPHRNQASPGNARGFLFQLDSRDGHVVFGTYLGGSDGLNECISALAFDPSGKLWVWGDTDATSFPVTANAAQHESGGDYDGFLVRIAVAAPTSTTLTSSPNPAEKSETVTLTALVVPGGASGTVTFYDGDAAIGSAVLSNGSATFATTALMPGPHSLTAVYAGDSAFASSTSAPLIELVGGSAKRRSARH